MCQSAGGMEWKDAGPPGLWERGLPPDLATPFPEASCAPGTWPHPVMSEVLGAPGATIE